METAETNRIDEIPDDDAVPICECCLEPVPKDYALFCPKCGAPIDSLAAWLPFERIHAQGYVFRQAVEHPTKLITVIGIWIIFLVPAVLIAITFLAMAVSDPAGIEALVPTDYLVFAVILAVYLAISYRATRGYFASRRAKP